jgi:hypothetical protein
VKAKTENEQLSDLLQRAATLKGPISDALTDAARDLAGGRPRSLVQSSFLARVRQIVRGGEGADVEPRGVYGGEGRQGLAGAAGTGEAAAAVAQPPRDLLGAPERAAATQREAPEPTIRTDPNQATMPGMEPSAVQAQAARDAQGRGGIGPTGDVKPADEGLFAARDAPGQGKLYSFPGPIFDPDQWRSLGTSVANGIDRARSAMANVADLLRQG